MLQAAIGAGLLTMVLATAGDRTHDSGRIMGESTAARRIEPSALPTFALFGWVSPPVESTTAVRIAELAGAGLNLLLPAWEDAGRVADNLARLDLAAANGARCLIWDARFEGFLTLDVSSPAGVVLLDSIVATYRVHPGFAGYYLGDEPPASEFPLLARLHQALRAHDPDHPAYNDLISAAGVGGWSAWQGYVRAYLDSTHARVLCYNQYDFFTSGDRGQFVQHLAGAAAIAREYGIPFWTIVQVIQHGNYRALTDGELRWQVSMALAYGARGVGYFTYWTPAPDPAWNWQYGMIGWDGSRTHWYDTIAALDPHLRAAGLWLTSLDWLGTEHAGSVPIGATAFTPKSWIAAVEGRAALGMYVSLQGMRYLVVANSDSLAARAIGLTLPGAVRVARLEDDGSTWTTLDTTHTAAGPHVELDLAAGDFMLLEVVGPGEPLRLGAGPAMRVEPNPAGASVRFELSSVRAHGRVTILDAGGRRIWSRAVAEGSNLVTWNGTRDAGGVAPAGLYFARAEDAGGATTLRVSWLGR